MSSWTNVADVRRYADSSTTDFTDAQLEEFIGSAQKEVNAKLITKVYREPITYIDGYRQNKIDGSNKTYFCRMWKTAHGPRNYFGDTNFDNEVDINDIRVVQFDPNTSLETELVVDSIDIDACSFTLHTAPSNVQLYVDYSYSGQDPVNPDPFVQMCVAYLSASYCYIGTDGFVMKFGNVSIQPGSTGGKGKQLFDKYTKLIEQLLINTTGGSLWDSMAVKI